jgi:hypothetical protein
MGNIHSSLSDQSSSAKSEGWAEYAARTTMEAVYDAASKSVGHGFKRAVAKAVAGI